MWRHFSHFVKLSINFYIAALFESGKKEYKKINILSVGIDDRRM
jgi:hypothetical protein